MTGRVVPAVSERAMRASLDDYAAPLAEMAGTPAQQAYWRGMRDTLRVVLGETTELATRLEDVDGAAEVLLRADRTFFPRG